MIIVTGSINSLPDRFDDLLACSLEHVRRSRTEAGCISHAVYRDVENPLRLVFYEEWSDRAALLVHFAVPASRAFVKAAAALASAAPAMQIHEAQAVRL